METGLAMLPSMRLVVRDLGRVPYAEALALQRDLARRRQAGEVPDTLLLCEHPPVVTLGRASRPEHLLASREALERRGVEVFDVERGGDVTYHGPGQLVGYPIVDLHGHGRDLHRYLRALEEVIIRTAAAFGVAAGRVAGKTGVWVGDRKLASIGIHVSRWVSWHGLAVNVTDEALPGFELIVPCGLAGVRMTTLTREAGRPVTLTEAKRALEEAFRAAFTPSPAGAAPGSHPGGSR
ncbi:MAG TPA: lipoyl(octanoyl) transferase LipB [Thermodesulfobacteriota bacterium]